MDGQEENDGSVLDVDLGRLSHIPIKVMDSSTNGLRMHGVWSKKKLQSK